jgi:hypothetical protein
MFIIWGNRTRATEIGMGRFVCPFCRALRTYRRKRVTRYFHLYFIPLFQTGTVAEIVQCQKCFQSWRPEVLRLKPLQPGPDGERNAGPRLASAASRPKAPSRL